ncbi:MAG TPA: spermidine synthase [Casimicrobiaceae bacterium]|nr:spermidine synthase [Casimicrobiaceae bacterium]
MTAEASTLASARTGAAARAAPWVRVLCVLFFFSGFPALIYQLVWQRALFRIFGVNIESVTIVVTAFMLGLGLGSLAGGWLSKRRGIPLLPLLAAIELLTASFGMFSLGIFDRAGTLVLGLPLPLTAAIALALVLVPTLLMGATLPILVSHLARRSGNVGSSVGLLYYVNTLGAGAACLFCIALLFPFLGMQRAVYVAVTMNAAVAMGALVAYFRERRGALPGPEESRQISASSTPILRFSSVLGLACASGFISLSYEIFFFRTISYASGSSATAFAGTLGAFLVGLASGSREAGVLCATAAPDTVIKRVEARLIVANAVGLLFLPILDHMAWLKLGVLGIALALVYVLARCWGMLLPCLAQLGIAADSRTGMRTAWLYLANILGSAAGSILTGFVLMDHLTLIGIAGFLVVAGLTCSAALMFALPVTPRQKWRRAGLTVACGVLFVMLLPVLASNVLEGLLPTPAGDSTGPFARVVENRNGIITVDRSGVVYGDGSYDGRFNTDLVHDTNGIVRPFSLSLYHAAPHDVLMIGLSSGSWAQVIANNPEVSSFTIVEINPGYLKLVAEVPEVASVLTNPKVTIVIDDGRRWLRLNRVRRFDVIVSNTTFYFRANAANLLSTDFLELIKRHLRPGGIFFYNTTSSDRVQRTACLAFPFGARFTNHMVVSASPIVWDFERWRRTLGGYRIDGQPVLDPSRSEDRAALDQLISFQAAMRTDLIPSAQKPIEPCAEILVRTEGKDPVTDDNMGSEWRHYFRIE